MVGRSWLRINQSLGSVSFAALICVMTAPISRGPCIIYGTPCLTVMAHRMKRKDAHIGSSLDDFLKEEGILEESRAATLKEALAWQVQKAMKRQKINKVQMARRMNTSRAALDRLLDPGNSSVTLQTLCRAARAIGRDLRIELV